MGFAEPSTEGQLVLLGHPVELEHVIDRSQMVFGIAVAVEAPAHAERLLLAHHLHGVDATVARDAADAAPHVGRGGWSWYTGSAGWMYRLGLEAILGLRRMGKCLYIEPRIPKDWPAYDVMYRSGETSYHIHVENQYALKGGVKQITLDGELLPKGSIPLADDGGQHEVHVLLG